MQESFFSKVKTKFNFYTAPKHISIFFRDALNSTENVLSDRQHLETCISWLLHAQDRYKTGGVSLGYSFRNGWLQPYPETTGYIIDTLVDHYHFTRNQLFLEKAKKMGNWEIEIQLPDGSVRVGNPTNTVADVFDTGMVILGLCTLFSETGEKHFLDAAVKAGNWLINIQDNDGSWSKSSYKDIPHAYHSKVSWALYRLYKATGNNAYQIAVQKNLDWIYSQKKPNNWFDYMSFSLNEDPYTHTIAYTLQGFMGIHLLMEEGNPLKPLLLTECKNILDILIRKFKLDDNATNNMLLLPGTISKDWSGSADYTCITGNAQFSILLLEMFRITKNFTYYNAATNLINIVKKTHRVSLTGDITFENGLAGSFPIWGGYHPHEYPNWVPKFFADALLLKIKIDSITMNQKVDSKSTAITIES